MAELQFGMVGLGVMGQNLALNIAEKGFPVGGWDAWPEPVDKFVASAAGAAVKGFKALPELVASLRKPRRIILLVKAGDVVDKTLAQLVPLLEKDDMVVDGGNEYFKNTERRAKELATKGLRFFGMGVSGGQEGARHGPSMMPGGDRAGYDDMAPVLTKVAAQADGPCVTYIGPGGSGHYVKMVHNGIEYGDMQLIAEAYDLLKHLGGLTNGELADTFAKWNEGELQSYLIEITSQVFRKKDPDTGKDRWISWWTPPPRRAPGSGPSRRRRRLARRCPPSPRRSTLGSSPPSASCAGRPASSSPRRPRRPAPSGPSSSSRCGPRCSAPRRAATPRAWDSSRWRRKHSPGISNSPSSRGYGPVAASSGRAS
jgi:6-phosphogluconate dehydrogenase (decarboxylating)